MQIADQAVKSSHEVDAADVDSLVADLASVNGVTRISARKRLIEIGSPAVPALLCALDDRKAHVRWEAAKTLGEIADPAAASSLIAHLDDKNMDVRWVSAMALVNLGPAVLSRIARALSTRDDEQWLAEGAHHVCYFLKHKFSDELAAALLFALDTQEPELAIPRVAYRIHESRPWIELPVPLTPTGGSFAAGCPISVLPN